MTIFTAVTIEINGSDVSGRLQPLMTSVSVERSAGKAADSATIELANPDAKYRVPKDRDQVKIKINGDWVFEGFVNDVNCHLAKSGGRTISVSASSMDHGAKVKEPVLRHKDDATLEDVMKDFGGKAGLDVTVIGSVASIKRAYWLQQNESFSSWAHRVAREVGGTLKIIGNRAFFTARNEGVSSSGRPLTTIIAAVGRNLKSADLQPVVNKPRYKKVKISYFDIGKGERIEEEVDTGIDGVDAALRTLFNAADKDQAKIKAGSLGKESDREKGGGSVTILGDTRAEPEGKCAVSGVMEGADGTYLIDGVTHSVSKSSGFETKLELRKPET